MSNSSFIKLFTKSPVLLILYTASSIGILLGSFFLLASVVVSVSGINNIVDILSDIGIFEEIKFSIDQLEETLTRKIDRVKDDVRNLEDSFETFKRSTNRTVRDVKQTISTIQDDINTLNLTVFPPVEEEEEK